MFSLSALVATLLLSSTASAVSTTVAYPQPSQPCVSGLHMIVARASLENQGEGMLSSVTDMIKKQIPNSDSVAVVYPATLDQYVFSEQEGVVGMKQLVTDYVSRCQGGKIALLGYSQGAQVVGDTVIGAEEKGFSDDTTNPTGLGSSYLDPIVAMIMMGDPAFTTNNPGHVGNASKDGVFPRTNVDSFAKYGLDDKMQTYCDDNDEYCAAGSGKNALAIHVGYVNEYGSSAAAYVVSKFSNAPGATGAASGGSSSGSASMPASTSAAATKASSGAASASKPASSNKASTTAKPTSNNPLTSQRYHPYSGTFTGGTFMQPPDLVPTGNVGGINTMDKGVSGAVFGFAMFIMGML